MADHSSNRNGENMENNLKNCPFCGYKWVYFEDDLYHLDHAFDCYLTGRTIVTKDEERAWNHRAPSPAVDASKVAAEGLAQVAANHPELAFDGEDVRAIAREIDKAAVRVSPAVDALVEAAKDTLQGRHSCP